MSPATPADEEKLVFKEDSAAGDTARVGGGARGENSGPNVFLLVSQRVGKTVQEQPTIFWYLTAPSDSDVDLVVSKPGRDAPVYRQRLRSQAELSAGLHAFPLTGTAARLETGVRYQVTVTVWTNADDPSLNPFSTGFIERVPTPPSLATLGPNPGPKACAAAGLWYDALDALAREIEQHPADLRPRRQRVNLLREQHVFLTFAPKAEWDKIAGMGQAQAAANQLEKERLEELVRQDEQEASAGR